MSNFCTDAKDSPSWARSLRGSFAQSVQHFLLARCRGLFLCEYVSVQAIYSFEADDVLTAKIGDGAANIGLAVGALAKFTGDLGSQLCVNRTGHHFERARNLIVGEHIQEGGLPQRHSQGLLQRVIEDGVTRAVGKIADDNRVLFRELGSTVGGVKITHRCENADRSLGSRNENLP